MLSKSLLQFSVDGQRCVPSLLCDLRPNSGGGNEDNSNLLQKVPCTHCCTQCSQPCSRLPLTYASTGDSWTLTGSLGQSLVGSLLLSPWSWCMQGSVCALQDSVSPVLCKFWQLYGWVNGDLLQKGLCHTQVCCTQSPCPCGRPLLTHIFAGDTQTQFCLSFWTVFRDTRKNHDAPRHTDYCSLVLQETILPIIRVSIAEKAVEQLLSYRVALHRKKNLIENLSWWFDLPHCGKFFKRWEYQTTLPTSW